MSPGRLARKAAWVALGLAIPLLAGRFVFSLVLPMVLPSVEGRVVESRAMVSASTSTRHTGRPGSGPAPVSRVGLYRESVEFTVGGRTHTAVSRQFLLGGHRGFLPEQAPPRRSPHPMAFETPVLRKVHYLPGQPAIAIVRHGPAWFELVVAVFVLLPVWLLLIPPRLWMRLLAWHQLRRARP